MRVTEQDDLFAKTLRVNTIASIAFATPFHRQKSTALFIKVKPINFLNNSNLLSDVFTRGDCIICNLETGTIFIVKGNEHIFPWNAVIYDKGKIE